MHQVGLRGVKSGQAKSSQVSVRVSPTHLPLRCGANEVAWPAWWAEVELAASLWQRGDGLARRERDAAARLRLHQRDPTRLRLPKMGSMGEQAGVGPAAGSNQVSPNMGSMGEQAGVGPAAGSNQVSPNMGRSVDGEDSIKSAQIWEGAWMGRIGG
jgi:hypothetical protein